MKNMHRILTALSLIAFLPVMAHAAPPVGAAVPTAPATKPAPVSASPQATSASYGDWVMQCAMQKEEGSDKAVKKCSVMQSIQMQGQAGILAQLQITSAKEGVRLVVVLPGNILIKNGPQAMIDEKDAAPVDLIWTRCFNGACLAEGSLTTEQVNRWRAQSEKGRVVGKDSTGKDNLVPFSFRGLAQALDALQKS